MREAAMNASSRNRIEVMHGVNLDQLGGRDPLHYGSFTLSELETQIGRYANDLGSAHRLLPDQPRGRVRRAAAPPARALRRADPQLRRLDPLQLGDPRRARGLRAAGGRGPPLRRPRPRGVAPRLGLRWPGPGADLGQEAGGIPRGARAPEGGAGRMSAVRSERLAAAISERGLDALIVGDLVRPGDSGPDAISNIRWLTGFTGTSGLAVIGPEQRSLPDRLPLHRSRRKGGRSGPSSV